MNKTKEELVDDIYGNLEKVVDPELGIDIVNLGLIYNIDIDDNGKAIVTMTLTTIGCPISELLEEAIRMQVLKVENINECEIDIVWEPAWDVSKMSRFARLSLGIHI